MKNSSYTPTSTELTIYDFCHFHGQFVIAPKYIDDIPKPKSDKYNDLLKYRKKHIDTDGEEIVNNIMGYLNHRFNLSSHKVSEVANLELGKEFEIINILLSFYGDRNIGIEDFGRFFGWNYFNVNEITKSKSEEFILKQKVFDLE